MQEKEFLSFLSFFFQFSIHFTIAIVTYTWKVKKMKENQP